jgi:hypothetical protein
LLLLCASGVHLILQSAELCHELDGDVSCRLVIEVVEGGDVVADLAIRTVEGADLSDTDTVPVAGKADASETAVSARKTPAGPACAPDPAPHRTGGCSVRRAVPCWAYRAARGLCDAPALAGLPANQRACILGLAPGQSRDSWITWNLARTRADAVLAGQEVPGGC